VAGLLGGALPGLAADGTLYTPGVNAPGGLLWLPGNLGGHLWVADHVDGFCRLDPAGPNNYAKTNCASALTGLPITSPGQASYDPATNSVYLPDNAAGPAATAVWRLQYDPVTETVGSPVSLAPVNDATGIPERPTGTAIGPDGHLYVSAIRGGAIVRITNPSTNDRQLQRIALTSDGLGGFGLAFLGNALYVAEAAGVARINNATACLPAAPCLSSPLPVPLNAPGAVAVRDGLVYIGDINMVWRYNPGANTSEIFSAVGVISGVPVELQGVSAMGFDPAGNFYFGDDPTAGAGTGGGRVWTTPAGAPAGGSFPGIKKAQHVGTGLTNTGLTAPGGFTYMGANTDANLWYTDHVLGICRLDRNPVTGLFAINQATCRTGSISGGQPIFDGTANVYVPDNAARVGEPGVRRWTFTDAAGGGSLSATPTVLHVLNDEENERPTGLAVDAGGANLYVSYITGAGIGRISNPGGTPGALEMIATTATGGGGFGLALIGNSLYIAEEIAVSVIPDITVCSAATPCSATVIPEIVVSGAAGLWANGNTLYVADTVMVRQIDTTTSPMTSVALAGAGFVNGSLVPFQGISAVIADPVSGFVYAADDPSFGGAPVGRLWQIALNADLAVTKGAAPSPVNAPGEPLTYTVTVTNDGPDPIDVGTFPTALVTLTDTLPAGVTFTSLTAPAGWNCTTPAVGATGTVTCTLATGMAVGATAEFVIVVATNAADPYGTLVDNTATVALSGTDPLLLFDQNPGNDTVTVTTRLGVFADMGVTLASSSPRVVPGRTFTYTATATNLGPDATTNPALTLSLPAEVEFQSLVTPAGWNCTAPAVGATGDIQCTAPTLAATASAAVVATVAVVAATPLETPMNAGASVTSDLPDPLNTANNAAANTVVAGLMRTYLPFVVR
jgi:uncharacterized repeat protein (TIGR01451 family)